MKTVHGIIIALAAVIPLLFSGCSDANDIDNEFADDENYQLYLKLSENGELDDNGCYSMPPDESAIPGSGDILVSFAENRYLDMRYRLSDGTIVTDKCYLNAGDTIYSEKPANKTASATTYKFDRFEIRSNDGYDVGFKFEDAENDTCKLTVPEDFRGKSLTVLPLGKFLDRSVLCRAIDYDENENEITVDGTWSLCGNIHYNVEKKSEITTLTFSGITGYSVRFDFDPEYYYVVETSDIGADIIKGSVRFPSVQPSLPTPDYGVKLRKFVSIEFSNKEYIDSVTVNGTKADVSSGVLKGLKQQSSVDIKLKDGFRIAQTADYISAPREVPGSRSYTITAPNMSKLNIDIVRDGGSTNDDNSKYEGVTVNIISRETQKGGVVYPSPDKKYDIEITPKTGYVLLDPFHLFGIGNVVGDDGVARLYNIKGSDCDSKIRETINSCLNKLILVYLTRNDDYGGTYEYYIDGNKVTGAYAEVREGQKLELNYSLNGSAGDKYCIDSLFKPSSKKGKLEIKPAMAGKTVVLDDFGIKVKER